MIKTASGANGLVILLALGDNDRDAHDLRHVLVDLPRRGTSKAGARKVKNTVKEGMQTCARSRQYRTRYMQLCI
ncbi:hypothetical protein EGJ50_07125 [Pseudomonas luteola]|nr:hypothetical protein EGJ50_07125 [Pseudomonas luteola]